VGCISNFNIQDNEPGGIENATHNTFPKLTWHEAIYRVIHERGISEFLFAATHYTHCNNILISNFENNYN
jgi:hypothetical protein